MARGLKLSFTDGKLTLKPNEEVSGFDAEVQNAMLNIGTLKGSDGTFPERGCDLLLRGLQGRLISKNAATHEANFAAVDTAFFVADVDTFEDHPIDTLDLQVKELGTSQLTLNARFVSVAGEVRGFDINL